jgi:hypothetical protein
MNGASVWLAPKNKKTANKKTGRAEAREYYYGPSNDVTWLVVNKT